MSRKQNEKREIKYKSCLNDFYNAWPTKFQQWDLKSLAQYLDAKWIVCVFKIFPNIEVLYDDMIT